jgi:hypothetical protein
MGAHIVEGERFFGSGVGEALDFIVWKALDWAVLGVEDPLPGGKVPWHCAELLERRPFGGSPKAELGAFKVATTVGHHLQSISGCWLLKTMMGNL